jgi:uncharacterized membrane protein YhaH (DUF805 family)
VNAKGALLWLVQESLPAVGLRRLLSYAPTLKGRGTRTEMCSTITATIVASFLYALVFPPDPGPGPWFLVTALQVVVFALPLISAIVRRLHDAGRYGWAVFVVIFPYLGAFWLMYLLFSSGVEGENEFGPNPRGWRPAS